MSKPKMIGKLRPYTPNNRMDMRRMKQYRRNREYTDRHEEIMTAKREARQIRELEAIKRV